MNLQFLEKFQIVYLKVHIFQLLKNNFRFIGTLTSFCDAVQSLESNRAAQIWSVPSPKQIWRGRRTKAGKFESHLNASYKKQTSSFHWKVKCCK